MPLPISYNFITVLLLSRINSSKVNNFFVHDLVKLHLKELNVFYYD